MEEDIKNLEKLKAILVHLKNYGWINDLKRDIEPYQTIISIENILIDYKQKLEALDIQEKLILKLGDELEKLQQENEELKTEIDEHVYWETTPVEQIKENYISKSIIKNKIEELQKSVDRYIKLKEYNQVDIQMFKVNILKELLEE